MSEAIRSRRVTVGDTEPVLLAQAQDDPVSVVIRNPGPASVDLGGSDVESGEGFDCEGGGAFRILLKGRVGLYGIAPEGASVVLRVLEADV